ncbi:MAG: hypothetical protein WCS30_07760 [Selenomonadaceae bacterium]
MKNEKWNLIVEHALLNEDNLLLSLEMFEAFEEVMNRLISEFLKDLEIELLLSLGSEWTIENRFEDNTFKKWTFGIQKKEWQGNYIIGINPENGKLRNFTFYTWRDEAIFKSPITEVTKMLNENYRKGRTYQLNDWYQSVDKDYLNWMEADTLRRLYHKKEFVAYFKEQFLLLKDIVEPIIDKKMKNHTGLSMQKQVVK